MHIPWDDLRLFVVVAEAGSTAKAAKRLRTSQPTVSRRLAMLEDLVGAQLFERSVLGVRLTAAGERLAGPARRMAEWAAEIDEEVAHPGAGPRGVVRITAPPGVAYELLAPLAAQLRRTLTEVRLEVASRVSYLDLGRREADLALRTAPPSQRDLVELARLTFDNDAWASAAYRATLPKRPKLTDLDFIAWAPPYEALTPNRELSALVPGFVPAFASDDYLVQLRAAQAGVGVMFLGDVRHKFGAPEGLERLHIELGPHARGTLYLVASKASLALARVRAVAEELVAELGEAQRATDAGRPRRASSGRSRAMR